MLGPNELLNKIMDFAKNKFLEGNLIIYKSDLEDYVNGIDPEADSRNLDLVIDELDSRGWLLENFESRIKFDSACFQ